MRTSIVILTCNNLDYTKKCIESIRTYTDQNDYEIIVVDNGSTDETVAWLKQQTDLSIILNQENRGFPRGCNQGIKLAAGDNVLLLNNDTVVTANWLTNLTNCLYSAPDIGAVGPVTNACSNFQTIATEYQTLEEMQAFAAKHNQANPAAWEERLKLVGFCMLIKEEALNQIGLLDEIFTPGNYEDDDYSFRLRQAGYRLMLCHDTFIHHFGSTSFNHDQHEFARLLELNGRKFAAKWGFEAGQANNIRHDLLQFIDNPRDQELHILEVGCYCGADLLKIKTFYQQALLYGIEVNTQAAQIAKTLAAVTVQPAIEALADYPQNFFDYIIFPNTLEGLSNPQQVLQISRGHLKPGGKILASVYNQMHYASLRDLINGDRRYTAAGAVNRDQLRYATLNELTGMFHQAGYLDLTIIQTLLTENEDDKKFIAALNGLTGKNLTAQYETYQYIIQAPRSRLTDLLIRLDRDHNQHTDNQIMQILGLIKSNGHYMEQVINTVSACISNQARVLNLLAVRCHENGLNDCVIPFLEKALTYDQQSKDILINLALVLAARRKYQAAVDYLSRIKQPDPEVKGYLQTFTEKLNQPGTNNRQLKFVTLFPETENVHLTKDVGMIPYLLQQYFNYHATIACYKNGAYPYLQQEAAGLHLDFIDKYTGDPVSDGNTYLRKQAGNIDILHLFHLTERTLHWINTYKSLNPQGKIYLKLDANSYLKDVTPTNQVLAILQQCDLISVETLDLYRYLNQHWPLTVTYLPNGFYDYGTRKKIKYQEKENIICTVGRIGTEEKGSETLLQAFKQAAGRLPDWQLRLIGPVAKRFLPYIEFFFATNPELIHRVCFTGAITDKNQLAAEYNRAKIFCLTSRLEGFPLVLPEAAGNGCCIIASDLPPAWDITNNKQYGDIFPIDNVEALAHCLVSHCQKEKELKRSCTGIQNYAYKHFYWVDICKKLHQLLSISLKSD